MQINIFHVSEVSEKITNYSGIKLVTTVSEGVLIEVCFFSCDFIFSQVFSYLVNATIGPAGFVDIFWV